MQRKSSLKFKFLGYVGSIVVISFLFTIIFVTTKANNSSFKQTMSMATETGHRYSSEIKDMMGTPLLIARTIASSYAGIKEQGKSISREMGNNILKQALISNPDIMGAWTVWEPNAFDGKDAEYVNKHAHDESGRFIPYWNRSGGLHNEKCVDYNEPDGYYYRPLNSKKEIIMEPVTYEIAGKNLTVVSVCVPVIVNGKAIAIVGADYEMHTFLQLAKKTKILNTGYILVTGGNGAIIAHPQEEVIGKNVSEFNPEERVNERLQNNEEFTFMKKSTVTNSSAYYIHTPIVFGGDKNNWGLVSIVPEKEIYKDSKSIRNVAVLIGFISILFVLAILYWIGEKIVSKPVLQVMNGVKDIAQGEGDLTKRLEIENSDEIGELSYWFNRFIDNLQEMIKTISSNVGDIDGSSQELLGISENVKSETENTSSRAELVAAAAEELSSNMNGVSGAMDETSSNINGVASAMEQMTATVNEIASNAEKTKAVTEDAVGKAGETSGRMDELGKAANEIGNVVETITDISDQTNLLALNATIEAARAGEAGKGFAVVANEIKDLASQTTNATNEIKEKISWIQTATNNSVTDMSSIKNIIVEISEFITTIATAVEEQSVSSDEISNNVNQAAQGVNEVNDSVAQSSQVSEEIAKDISEVNRAVGSIEGLGKTIYNRSESLSSTSDVLRKLVQGFKVD